MPDNKYNEGMKYPGLPSSLFIRNRFKLTTHLFKGSAVILSSNRPMPRNGDQYYEYRQSSDFYYLTGITQEGSFLLLFPDHPNIEFREILFLPQATEKNLKWEGQGLSKERALEISGIENIMWSSEFNKVVDKLVPKTSHIYYNSSEDNEMGSSSYAGGLPLRKSIQQKFPSIEEMPLGQILQRLRMIKEPEEIEIIRKSAAITEKAFRSILRELKPGMKEYEIEALIAYEFLRNGAEGPAFESIVASGRNALILHYIENTGMCEDGNLLLLDIGADLAYYASDCSRTIPVNGKFSRRQLEIYSANLRVIKHAMSLMTVGKRMADFNQEVCQLLEKEHIDLGLYTLADARNSEEEKPLWSKYYWHGTSHSIGIDVHDPMDKELPFQPGLVLSCEPGIYIREEGIGIRLENDILITEDGPVDLTANIPIEPVEIEALMNP
jgi:Xaa-Pro aminopeptidase